MPIVADVIEHAITLQSTAAGSIDRVERAAGFVERATANLGATQVALAANIEKGVGKKVDEAINGAAGTISKTLTDAETQSRAALKELTAATQAATRTIQAEAARLKGAWQWTAGISAAIGFAVGGLLVFILMR